MNKMNDVHRTKLKRNVTLLYISDFFRSLIFIIPVWVAFELQYISLSQMMTVEAVIMITQLVLELPTGAIADIFGRRFSTTMGLLFSAVGMVVYYYSRSFEMFLGMAILVGIGEALVSGSREALTFDSLKELGKSDDFSKVASKGSMIFQYGLAIGTFIGGAVSKFGLQIPLLMYAIALVCSAITSMFSEEPLIDSEKFTVKSYLSQIRNGIKELGKNEHIRLISLFYILVGSVTWSTQLVFGTMYLATRGYSPELLGILFPIMRIVNGVVLFQSIKRGWLSRKRVYVLFPLLLVVALLPAIWFSMQIAFISIAIMSILSTARWVLLGKYTNEEFSSKNRATAISTLSMGIGLLYVAYVLVAGQISDRFGVGAVMSLMGIFTVIVILPVGLRLRNNTGNK